MTNEILQCIDPKYAAAAFSSNRKQSGSKASPSTSPTLAKHALPPTTTTEPVQSTVSRPPALRSQSYSKRHASFDTPREVPMPSIPAGASSIDPIALDDSDMERNQAAAGRKHAPRQPQPGSRYTDTSRKPTNQPSSSFRRASAAAPSSSDNSARDKLHIDLANEAHGHAPSLARNNSAPTPPHTPSAERMDLRYPQPNDTNTPDSGTSGSGSEQTSPALDSDNVEVPGGGYPDADTMARAAEQRKKIESMNDDSRNRADVIFKEGRLSTASLPLPRSYGAERVSLLPPPVRPSTKNGNGSGSGSGSDGGQQAKTPTNFASTPNATIGELDLSKVSNANSSTAYRTSYPFAGSFARDVPLIPGPRESSLTADVEKNTQAGTAWRSSGPFMRREYNEEDSEEKSAISRGQFTKQPEIEAPAAPLHPLLDPSNLTTPSASNRAFNFGPSSTTATPGHEQSSPDATTLHRPALSALTPSEGGAKGSPAPSADRTSTASGSSGASSELPTFSERSGSSFVLPKGPAASNDNSSKSPEVLPRPRPTTEPIPSVSTSSPTMTVDTTPSAYILEAFLPGYQRDEITLSTRKKRILHVVADGFVSGGGEFDRL